MSVVKKIMFYMIYGVSILFLGMVITVSLAAPTDNLLSWQMIIGVLTFSALLLLFFWIWEKVWRKAELFPIVYPLLCAFFGASLYWISCIGRNDPMSFVDYGVMWDNAWAIANGNDIINADYFMVYYNNFKPMLLLSLLFRIALKLGWEDPFYFVLIISVLAVLSAVWAVCVLTEDPKSKNRLRIPVLFFFLFCLPIWSNTQAFYTDTMSFAVAIVVLALIKRSAQRQEKPWKILLAFLAGMLTAIGISIKVTSCIPLIAAGIVLLFIQNKLLLQKLLWSIIGGLAGCAVMWAGITMWAQTYEISQKAKEIGDPVIAWVGLGLKGSGSYAENLEFLEMVRSFPTKAQKAAYCKEYIWENRSYFWDLDHIIQKIRYNYASGHFGNTDFTYIAKYENNILWELFAPYGRFYWRTSQISFCYLFASYVICFLGNLLSVVQFHREKKVSPILMIADLSMVGYFIFLMIWETNNRQLYNLVPVIILASVLHARQIVKWLLHLKRLSRKQQPDS